MKYIKCKEIYDDDFKFCPYCGEKKPEGKICLGCKYESMNMIFVQSVENNSLKSMYMLNETCCMGK